MDQLIEVRAGELIVNIVQGTDIDDSVVQDLLGARFLSEADLPKAAGPELQAYYDPEFKGNEVACFVPGFERKVYGPLMIVGVQEDGAFRGLTEEEVSRFSLVPPAEGERHPRLAVAPVPSS